MAEDANVFPLGSVTEVEDYDGPAPDGLTGSGDTPPRKVYTCAVCDTELTYGGRGKPPKYCAEHRKGGSGNAATSPTRTARSVSTKADREAKELGARLDGQLVKVAMMVAPFDVYDGMTVAVMRKPVVEQYEGVMRTHDEWRALALKAQTNGSVVGLALSVLMLAAPILAHHGMVPEHIGKIPVGHALQSLPSIMARMEQAAKAGDEVLNEYMSRMRQEEASRKAKSPTPDANAS